MANYTTQKSRDGTIRINFRGEYIAVVIPTNSDSRKIWHLNKVASESVNKNEKITFCVSCQIGCAVGCKFCYTSKLGFKRNLTADEIFNQVLIAKEVYGKVPTAVVFMGMGEPTLNLGNVLEAGERIHQEFGLSYNKITISTSCLKNIDKLVNSKFNLALSLHSPFDKKRKELMPTSISVRKIVKFANDYVGNSNNKKYIMIEYAMIKGENDSDRDLEKLISLDWPKKTLFNLIEFNDIDNFKASPLDRMLVFKDVLIKNGWKCFIRNARGRDIEASCGMLN